MRRALAFTDAANRARTQIHWWTSDDDVARVAADTTDSTDENLAAGTLTDAARRWRDQAMQARVVAPLTALLGTLSDDPSLTDTERALTFALVLDLAVTDSGADPALPQHLNAVPPGLRNRLVREAAPAADLLDTDVADVLELGWNSCLVDHLAAAAVTHPDAGFRRAVAGLPTLDPGVQTHLALDPDPTVRLLLADSPSLTTAAASALARDADPSVRAQVAASPATPAAALTALVDDPDPGVRDAARRRVEDLATG